MENKKLIVKVNKSLDSIEKTLSNYLIIQKKNLESIKLEIDQIKATINELESERSPIIIQKDSMPSKKKAKDTPDFKGLFQEIVIELKESEDGHTSQKLSDFINSYTIPVIKQFCDENNIIVDFKGVKKAQFFDLILTAKNDMPRI